MVSSFLNQLANSVFLSPVGRRSSGGDGGEGGLVRPRRGHRLSRRSSTMQVCHFFDINNNRQIITCSLFVLKQRPTMMMSDTREEIVLPSLGEAGEIVNAVATALLNAVTVYKFQ